MDKIRRYIAMALIYSMLGSQLMPAFAAADTGGSWPVTDHTVTATGSNQDVINHSPGNAANSVADQKTDGYDTTSVVGSITFLGADANAFDAGRLKLSVDGKIDHGVSIGIDKENLATDSNAEEVVWLINDLDSEDHEMEDISTWNYMSEEVPLYDTEGNSYTFGIFDERYPVATASQLLYYTDSDHVLIGDDGEWAPHARNLVYVGTTTISGYFDVSNGRRINTEELQLNLSTENDEDMAFADLAEIRIDSANNRWYVLGALTHNPQTAEPIIWRLQATGDEHGFLYENTGRYEAETEYLYDGGTIIPASFEYQAAGVIRWNDGSNWHGKRPDDLSAFRVIDGDGTDVSNLVSVELMAKDDNEWHYLINGLDSEKEYYLSQSHPYYEHNETETRIPAGDPDSVVTIDEIEMKPVTVRYQGYVHWQTMHSLFAPAETLDFLTVYSEDQDITKYVVFNLAVSESDPGLWYYELDGLLTGMDYSVKIAAPEGYYSNISGFEIQTSFKSMAARGGGLMLPAIGLRASEEVTIRVANDTSGLAANSSPTFSYELMVDNKPYTGTYILTDHEGNETEGNGSTFRVGANKAISIKFQKAGTKVSIVNNTSGSATMLIGQTDDENLYTMYHATTTSEYAQIVWNDENNVSKKRIAMETMRTDGLKMQFKLAGTDEWIVLDSGNYDLLGLDQSWAGFGCDAENEYAAEWLFQSDLLPTYALGAGNTPLEVSYQVVSAEFEDLNGKADYLKESKGVKITVGSNEVWQTIYTLAADFTAHVQWFDDNHYNKTRMSSADWLKILEFYRKSTNPEVKEGELVPVEDDFAFELTGEDTTEWAISAAGLPAYDAAGYPYHYYLIQKDKGVVIDPNNELINAKEINEGTLRYDSLYNNIGIYLNETNSCYDNGTIKNILSAEMTFSADKEWLDDGRPEAERPVIPAYLWRYVQGNAPETAAQVKGGAATIPTSDGKITFADIEADKLPAFNAQGQEYIYFVWENLSQISDYESEAENKPWFSDLEVSDDILLNSGTLYNRRIGYTGISATKYWNARAIQSLEATVTVNLQRRATASDAWEYVETRKHTFTPETPAYEFIFERSEEAGKYEKYDKYGVEYEYRIIETKVEIKGEGEANIPLSSDTDKEINYSVGKYDFVLTYDKDGNMTNRLQDFITYKIKKTWSLYTKPGDEPREKPDAAEIRFHLHRNGTDICKHYDPSLVAGHKGHFILNSDNEDPSNVMIWSKVLTDDGKPIKLPRYDANGSEYKYTISEDNVISSVTGANYYVSLDYTFDEDSKLAQAAITNGDHPGEHTSIHVTKTWLDDSDIGHREPVTVKLKYNDETPTDEQIAEGYSDTLVLTEGNNWEGWFWVPRSEIKDDDYSEYSVVEVKIGDHDVVTYGEGGEKQIKTENHLYVVTESGFGRSWNVQNKRIGDVTIKLEKKWSAGNTEVDGDYQVRFKLVRSTDNETITIADNIDLTKNDRKEDGVWKYTYQDKLAKYTDKGEHYTYEMIETAIYLPDQNGVHSWHSLTDGAVVLDDVRWESHVSQTSYVYGEARADDIVTFTATNARSAVRDLTFYKLWGDNDEKDGASRPDVYLELWRSPEGVPDVEELAARSAIWDKTKDYVWSCSFANMPKFDSSGRQYVYYAKEGMTGGSGESWKSIYYKSYDPDTETLGEPLADEEMPSGGAVLNLRYGTVDVKGRKVWQNMDGLKNEDYPNLTISLYQKIMAANGELGEETAVTDSEGKPLTFKIGPDESGTYQNNYQFENLPQFDEHGRFIQYLVKETFDNKIIDQMELYEKNGGGTDYVFTNRFKGDGKLSVLVTKEWNLGGLDEIKNPRPLEVEFDLYRVMQEGDEPEKWVDLEYTEKYDSKIITINATGSNAFAFENCSKYAPNGNLYRYFLKERMIGGMTEVPGYKVTMSAEDDTEIKDGVLEIDTNDLEQVVELTITNTYTGGETVEISGTKYWGDDQWSGEYYRPDFASAGPVLDLKLYRKTPRLGEEEMTGSVISWNSENGNQWKFSIKASESNSFMRYATTGEEYVYYVREKQQPGYAAPVYGSSSSVSGSVKNLHLSITNSLELVEVRFDKTWNDHSNLYTTRPDNLNFTVQKTQSGQENWSDCSSVIPVPAKTENGDNQTDSLGYYPKHYLSWSGGAASIEGQYEYRVVEQTAADYNEPVYSNPPYDESKNSFTTFIMNELKPAGTQTIEALKIWADADDNDDLRPDSVRLTLLRNNIEVASVVLDGEADPEGRNGEEDAPWHVTWKDWPAGNYTVVEKVEDVPDFYQVSVASGSDASGNNATGGPYFELTNTHKPIDDIKVTFVKTWDDWDNRWQMRPDDYRVILYKKLGNLVVPAAISDVYTVDSSNNKWTFEFTGLPYAYDKTPYTYFVKESTMVLYNPEETDAKNTSNSYKPLITKLDDSHSGTITLTNKANFLTSQLQKNWVNDERNGYQTRPDSMRFAVYQRRANSQDIWQRVTEEVLEQYLDLAETLPIMEKVLNVTEVNAGYNWMDIPVTFGDIDSPLYEYQIREVGLIYDDVEYPVIWDEQTGIGTSNNYTAIMTQGSNTTATNTLITAGSITVKKTWEDVGNQDGIRPSSVDVELYQAKQNGGVWTVDSSPISTATLDKDKNWTKTWDNLPKNAPDGSLYYYKLEEVNDPDLSAYEAPVYTSESKIEGYTDGGIMVRPTDGENVAVTITNEYTPKTMRVSVDKVWIKDGGKTELRPTEITYTLKSSIDAGVTWTEVGQKTSSAEKFYLVEWSDLPVKQQTSALANPPNEKSLFIRYQVIETAVTTPETYTASYSVSYVQGSITDAAENEKTITVTNELSTKVPFTVETIWEDALPGYNRLDEVASVTLQLYRKTASDSNYTAIGVAEVGVGDTVHIINGLDKYNSEGRPYTYYAKQIELKLVGGRTLTVDGVNMGAYTIEEDTDGLDADRKIIFTNTLQTRSITAEIIWDDNGNQDGYRPGQAELELKYDNGKIYPESKGKAYPDEKGRWSHTWNGYPVYHADGKTPFVYTVNELNIDKYTISYDLDEIQPGVNTITITNTHDPDTTDVTVYKHWEGDDDWITEDRPESIKVGLYRKIDNGEAVLVQIAGQENPAEIVKDNWQHTWTGVPKYANPNGNDINAGTSYKIFYYVKEMAPDDFGYDIKEVTDAEKNQTDITNTMKTTSVRIHQDWEDSGNEHRRPGTVIFQLERTADGGNNWSTAGKIIPLGTDDNISIEITGLPIRNKKNKAYRYRVKEVRMDDEAVADNRALGYRVIYGEEHLEGVLLGDLWVTNELETVSLAGTKTWMDGEYKDTLRPDDLELTLKSSPSNAIETANPPYRWDGKNSEVWHYTFENLPKYDRKNQLIQYTVEETVPFGYAVQTSDHINLTNIMIPTQSVTGSKTWLDQSDRFGLRPTDIKLLVKANGVLQNPQPSAADIIWDKETNSDVWTWKINGLPTEDKDGNTINYTVEEDTVTGYLASQSNYDIINSLVTSDLCITNNQVGGPETEFTFKVSLNLNGVQVPYQGTYTVFDSDADITLPGSVRTTSTPGVIIVKGDEKFTLADLPANVSYTVMQVKENDFEQYEELYLSGTTSADDMTYASISNRYYISLTGSKTWQDQSNRYQTRPDRITLTVYADNAILTPQPSAQQIVWTKSGDTWNWTINHLPQTDLDENEIQYTVQEEPVTGYIGSQDGFHFTNQWKTGGMTVTKIQDGGSATDFTFHVALIVNGVQYPYVGNYTVLDSSADLSETGEFRRTNDGSIVIQGGQKFYLDELPAGVEYAVTEDAVTSFKQVEAVNDTGTIGWNRIAEVSFTNRYNRSSGGGGGSASKPTATVEPKPPAEPNVPMDSGPVTPGPDNMVEVPGATGNVQVTGPNGEVIYDGPTQNGYLNTEDWEPGLYLVTIYDEHGVPSAVYILVEDSSLPKTGDTLLNSALPFFIMIGAAGSFGVTVFRRKKNQKK